MDLTASSAVNLPIISASLRLVVIWMGVRSIRCTYSGARAGPRLTFTTNFVFFMVSHYFYSTPTKGTPRCAGVPNRSGSDLFSLNLPRGTGVPLGMSRIHSACLDPGDVLLRQEPDEEEDEEEEEDDDEEEDEGDGIEDEDDDEDDGYSE
jgi:hypothetical protein